MQYSNLSSVLLMARNWATCALFKNHVDNCWGIWSWEGGFLVGLGWRSHRGPEWIRFCTCLPRSSTSHHYESHQRSWWSLPQRWKVVAVVACELSHTCHKFAKACLRGWNPTSFLLVKDDVTRAKVNSVFVTRDRANPRCSTQAYAIQSGGQNVFKVETLNSRSFR